MLETHQCCQDAHRKKQGRQQQSYKQYWKRSWQAYGCQQSTGPGPGCDCASCPLPG